MKNGSFQDRSVASRADTRIASGEWERRTTVSDLLREDTVGK